MALQAKSEEVWVLDPRTRTRLNKKKRSTIMLTHSTHPLLRFGSLLLLENPAVFVDAVGVIALGGGGGGRPSSSLHDSNGPDSLEISSSLEDAATSPGEISPVDESETVGLDSRSEAADHPELLVVEGEEVAGVFLEGASSKTGFAEELHGHGTVQTASGGEHQQVVERKKSAGEQKNITGGLTAESALEQKATQTGGAAQSKAKKTSEKASDGTAAKKASTGDAAKKAASTEASTTFQKAAKTEATEASTTFQKAGKTTEKATEASTEAATEASTQKAAKTTEKTTEASTQKAAKTTEKTTEQSKAATDSGTGVVDGIVWGGRGLLWSRLHSEEQLLC